MFTSPKNSESAKFRNQKNLSQKTLSKKIFSPDNSEFQKINFFRGDAKS